MSALIATDLCLVAASLIACFFVLIVFRSFYAMRFVRYRYPRIVLTANNV
jgi:hypothetical protein